jgi:uncharacterized damage-inducible protein DinB
MSTQTATAPAVLTPEQLLKHWQGHRALTRRVIETFPEKDLFNFSVGGMRPFSALAMELIRMSTPTVEGIATGNWTWSPEAGEKPATKSDLLALWDRTTADIDRAWKNVPPERWQIVDKAFGQWEGPNYGTLLYIIDNEVHHRAQGYVYLRALGIEPPAFWERG